MTTEQIAIAYEMMKTDYPLILAEAEKLFCIRDDAFHKPTLVFVERDGGGQLMFEDNHHLRIELPANCCNLIGVRTHLFAHEIIHTLRPCGFYEGNYFEEGMATWFADYYLRKCFTIRPFIIFIDDPKYIRASFLFNLFYSIDEKFVSRIFNTGENLKKKMSSLSDVELRNSITWGSDDINNYIFEEITKKFNPQP